jgi:hypothetical protein
MALRLLADVLPGARCANDATLKEYPALRRSVRHPQGQFNADLLDFLRARA